ncbi:MAG: hypothetical protein JWM57_2784 [Phycisphaerales bacterium]|nr:hypothetical protein [Phycisphaerales bacterium]
MTNISPVQPVDLLESAPAEQSEPQVPEKWFVGTLAYSGIALAALFAWLLLGDFALNMKERAINPMALIMLRGFTAPDWLVGLLVGSIPSAIGLIIGPIISVKSDRHRGRLGRRIPFILISTPFIVVAMLGLAVTPEVGAWIERHTGLAPSVSRVAVFTFFWSALEIASVFANSLFGALFNDVVPHAVIGRFFGLFRLVGLAAGVVFMYGLMGKVESHYKLLFGGVGGLYGFCIIIMCFMVKEGQYPPPPAKPKVATRFGWLRPLLIYLKECYGNPFFLWYFFSTTLGGLALAPVNTFAIYHARSVNLSDDGYGKCVGLSWACSMVLAYPIGVLADRLHPLRLGIILMVAYAVATALGFFFAFTASTFFIALALHTVVSGSYITGTASIAQRLLPRAKFAEICSAGGILGAFIYLFVPPSLGAFIGWMNHDYRYVFLLASILALLTAGSYLVLLRKFIAMGGDRSYVPPQD